jgi:hypothetical protein
MKSGTWFLLLFLPFIDVLTEIGVAASFPQLRALYGSFGSGRKSVLYTQLTTFSPTMGILCRFFDRPDFFQILLYCPLSFSYIYACLQI